MSKATFTPGPWKVVGFTFSDCKEQDECGFIVRANGMCASKANARVTEAAPDMYEALIRCVCELERASSMGINIAPCVVEYADGALRKARGGA
jgi:hypothetical protein